MQVVLMQVVILSLWIFLLILGFLGLQIVGLVFGLALVFATISGSLVMWGVVVFIVVISALRFAINILLRV